MGTSPQITHFEWGTLEIEGYDTAFKDAKLWPGGARAWDWNETGTQHVPGIQIDDVKELVEHGVEVVVLSKGVHERLQTKEDTLEWLADHDITTEVLQTERAIERYNNLVKSGAAVGALIHSTC